MGGAGLSVRQSAPVRRSVRTTGHVKAGEFTGKTLSSYHGFGAGGAASAAASGGLLATDARPIHQPWAHLPAVRCGAALRYNGATEPAPYLAWCGLEARIRPYVTVVQVNGSPPPSW